MLSGTILSLLLVALTLSGVLTYLIRTAARRYRILDVPDGRHKIHAEPVALLGGVALWIAFWVMIGYVYFYKPILGIEIQSARLLVLFYGSLFLLLLGIVDELRPLPSKLRVGLIVVLCAVLAMIMPLNELTNPFGGVLRLPVALGAGLVFAWLFSVTISVKLLDGVDGLAGSIVAVGVLVMVLLTLSAKYYQPNVALIGGLFLATLVGFLLFNLPPASIFLGESGSLFLGFMIAALAVMAGSKMATALMVMVVPVSDVARVIWIRRRQGRPIMTGDRTHLHFILLDRGWSDWQVLAAFTFFATVLGTLSLFLQTYQKVLALVIAAAVFFIFSWRVAMSGVPTREIIKPKF